jgi:hypothetical protein
VQRAPGIPCSLCWGTRLYENLGRLASRECETVFIVIACDKREAFAQGSECDEAIHSFFMPRRGLLRFARNDVDGLQRDEYDPHGEERGNAARLEP